jgi:hypothetical protein
MLGPTVVPILPESSITKPVPLFNLSGLKTRKATKRRAANTFTNLLRRIQKPYAAPYVFEAEPNLSEFTTEELRAARARTGLNRNMRSMAMAYGGKRRVTRKFSSGLGKKRSTRKQ